MTPAQQRTAAAAVALVVPAHLKQTLAALEKAMAPKLARVNELAEQAREIGRRFPC